MKNEADAQVAHDIREYGWHCLHVLPRFGEEGVGFTYTIGLVESYDHPELMIFGLGRERSHRVLCECANMIRAGTHFPTDIRISDVLARDFDVMFRPVRRECFEEYLGTALRHYGEREFEAYVLFWPDNENQFVWDSTQLSVQGEAMRVV